MAFEPLLTRNVNRPGSEAIDAYLASGGYQGLKRVLREFARALHGRQQFTRMAMRGRVHAFHALHLSRGLRHEFRHSDHRFVGKHAERRHIAIAGGTVAPRVHLAQRRQLAWREIPNVLEAQERFAIGAVIPSGCGGA